MQSSSKQHHVLVAEDDSFSQMAVQMILGSLKLKFTICADGEAVVNAYKTNKGAISLVLMDLHMPKLDGYQASVKIREAEKAMGIHPCKIIALSAGKA